MPNLLENLAQIKIGGELSVRRIGFGAMRIVGQPGNFGPPADRRRSLEVLVKAVELGINFIDTADMYGPGVSEELIAEALHPYSSDLVIATKGGIIKEGPTSVRRNGSPEYLRSACESSLRRLKLDAIDLYYMHIADPQVPIEDSMGELVRLQQAGKIKHIGVSNVSLDEMKRASAVADIAAVQNKYSLAHRDSRPTLEECERRGIAFIPYGPLGATTNDYGAPLANDHGVLSGETARANASPAQRAILWLLEQSAVTVPIPGTTSIEHLKENLGSAAFFGARR